MNSRVYTLQASQPVRIFCDIFHECEALMLDTKTDQAGTENRLASMGEMSLDNKPTCSCNADMGFNM